MPQYSLQHHVSGGKQARASFRAVLPWAPSCTSLCKGSTLTELTFTSKTPPSSLHRELFLTEKDYNSHHEDILGLWEIDFLCLRIQELLALSPQTSSLDYLGPC